MVSDVDYVFDKGNGLGAGAVSFVVGGTCAISNLWCCEYVR